MLGGSTSGYETGSVSGVSDTVTNQSLTSNNMTRYDYEIDENLSQILFYFFRSSLEQNLSVSKAAYPKLHRKG